MGSFPEPTTHHELEVLADGEAFDGQVLLRHEARHPAHELLVHGVAVDEDLAPSDPLDALAHGGQQGGLARAAGGT